MIILALVSALLLQIRDPLILGLAGGGLIGLFLVARLSLMDMARQIRPLLYLLAVLFILQGLLADWTTALVISFRMVLLILLASLVTLTTRFSDMMSTFQKIARPLSRFGINEDKIALAAAITIRFIPVLLEQFEEIRRAQEVRGGGRNMIRLLPPLLIRTLRMADDLADAIDARGFDTHR